MIQTNRHTNEQNDLTTQASILRLVQFRNHPNLLIRDT